MPEQPLPTPLEESAGIPDVWRDEVQSRLERYKRRRGGRRIEGAFSMRFPFPPQESAAPVREQEDETQEDEQLASVAADQIPPTDNAVTLPILVEQPGVACEEMRALEEEASAEATPASLATTTVAPAVEPEPEEEPMRLIELAPRPLPRRKVIAFPSPSYAPSEVARRIADPVQPEQLRILDVPEELQAIAATSFLEGLLDAPATSAPDARVDRVELPCLTVRAPRRIGAASIDALVTLGGAGLFAAAASRFLPALPPTKSLIACAAAVAVLLWASYQYLFLVYRGRTPGMTATRVRLQTFKGRSPDFRQRQLRVFGLYLSVLSLGMGLLWYFVDVDSLCWQDRISQTFPAVAEKS